MTSEHIPVLLNEVLFYLNPGPNENFVDGTFGGGGHARAILEKTGPKGKLLGIDLDEETLASTVNSLKPFKSRLITATNNFGNLEEILESTDFKPINGILLDLGLSSIQLAGEKGFSFKSGHRLDMRFGSQIKLDAYQIVNFRSDREIFKIIKDLGEEKFAKQIVKAIIAKREEKPIESAAELAEVISQAIPKRSWPAKIHPATRTFQALRIAVNGELENLKKALPAAVKALAPKGRLVVISYHSLEDRIVKQFFKDAARDCVCPPDFPQCRCDHRATAWLVTKKSVDATDEEILKNPRSRSAKLRVIEKI